MLFVSLSCVSLMIVCVRLDAKPGEVNNVELEAVVPYTALSVSTVYVGDRSTYVVEGSSNAWTRANPSLDTATTTVRRTLDIDQTL